MNRSLCSALILELALWIPLVMGQSIDGTVSKVLREELDEKNVPGGVVGVLSGTRVSCLAAEGIADMSTKAPVTTDMLFRLGSTTKMFVATAALLAAHEGKIDLNAAIRTYLPQLPPRLGSVTLHQLLSHTAGLYDEAPMYGPGDDGALARGIEGWTDERLFLQPGVVFSYSNPGYWLVGRILEVVDKKPFAEVMRDRIFTPLRMTRSTFRPEVARQYPMAAGHDRDEDIIDPPSNHAGTWPSGSLYSSARELMRFVSAVMNDGVLDEQQVFPGEVVRQLMMPYATVKGLPGTKYGYGLVFKTYRGEPVVYHPGARLGYGSIIDMAPMRKVAVVVMGNRTGSLLSKTVRAGFESEFPLRELENDGLQGGKFLTDEETMQPYVGRYVNFPPIEVEIYNRKAIPIFPWGGIMTLQKGQEKIPLRIINDTTATNYYQRIGFTLDPGGRVDMIHIEMHTFKRVLSQ